MILCCKSTKNLELHNTMCNYLQYLHTQTCKYRHILLVQMCKMTIGAGKKAAKLLPLTLHL